MSDFSLTITPLKASELPSEDTIIDAAQALIESTSSWKQGKTYHKNTVKTFHRKDAGASWHCRVSEHSTEEASFDLLWEKLGKDKAVNEKGFIPEVKEVYKIKEVSPTAAIWTMHYAFTPPVSARLFTVLQVFHLSETSPRTGIIVSIPIDPTSLGSGELATPQLKGVRGRYVSVERLLELGDGRTEWKMATSSDPGGLIPNFLAESALPSKIAQDVPHFMKWLQVGHEK